MSLVLYDFDAIWVCHFSIYLLTLSKRLDVKKILTKSRPFAEVAASIEAICMRYQLLFIISSFSDRDACFGQRQTESRRERV